MATGTFTYNALRTKTLKIIIIMIIIIIIIIIMTLLTAFPLGGSSSVKI